MVKGLNGEGHGAKGEGHGAKDKGFGGNFFTLFTSSPFNPLTILPIFNQFLMNS
jgi:hypothetical protein